MGGCGAAFPASATVVFPIAFTLLAAGAVLMLAGAQRGLALPWTATGLALAGTVALRFALASVARTRTREPGAPAAAGVVLILMAPSLLPPVARWVSTFPTSGGDGLSSNTVRWTVSSCAWWPSPCRSAVGSQCIRRPGNRVRPRNTPEKS
jgi:hypothetical protein